MDILNELLVSSEGLTTQIGQTGGVVKNLRRGVAELDEASRSLGTGSGSSFQNHDQMGAVRLLSQRNFDALQWTNDVNNLQFDGLYRPSEILEATDIDGYLAHNHDLIILSAVDEAKRGVEDDVREIARRWASNEWAQSRKQFVESLGHRSQLWGSGALVVRSGSGPGTVDSTEVQSPYSRSALPQLLSAPGGAFPALTPIRSSSSQQLATTAQTSELFKNHSKVVSDLNKGVFADSSRGFKVCTALAAGVAIPLGNGVNQDDLSKMDLIGYANLLEMMAEMTGEKSRNPFPPKFFSTVCFSHTDVASAALAEKKRFLTFHAIKHLQNQIWVDWSSAVDNAVHQGLLKLPPSDAAESKNQRLRAYVSQLWFNGDITPTRNLVLSPHSNSDKGTPVFAFIYHCLRIGDFLGAIKEVEKCIQAGLRNVERELLVCLTRFFHISQKLTDTLSVAYPFDQSEATSFLSAMSSCAVLYEEERRKNELDLDPYREYVLNLLSLKEQAGLSETAIPGSSLEDFLWGNLWFSQWSQFISAATVSSTVKYKVVQSGELALYEKVLEYGGSEYFDADRSSPFNYCTVLFCCHRFGDAVSYLWHAGKFLPAVHLTVACLHYGLILPHHPLTQNPRHNSIDRGVGSNITPSSLFEMFFSSALLSTHPELTLDYLVSLDLDWTCHVQGIEASLLETHKLKYKNTVHQVFQNFLLSLGRSQLSRIVGEAVGDTLEESQPADPISFRSRGHIDNYLSAEKTSTLLASCAYHLLTVKRESEAAMEFFGLAGRHSEVLEELCNRLSGVLSTGTSGSQGDKVFWGETSVKYYDTHIKVGHSAVLTCLSRDNKLGLVGCFEVLLNLTVFVDACVGRPADALDIIDGLMLFPRVPEEVQAASQHYPSLDTYIKRVADDILILTVECAKTLYFKCAGTGGRGVLSEKEQERAALRSRVKALVMFAGVIKHRLNRPNTANILARTEDTMS